MRGTEWAPTGQSASEQLPVRCDFRAGVAGADHHEGAARGPLARVFRGVGQFDLPGEVVPQVQRLGQATAGPCGAVAEDPLAPGPCSRRFRSS